MGDVRRLSSASRNRLIYPRITQVGDLNTMRPFRLALIALSLVFFPRTHILAETLGDARVGFSAERILLLDGKSFVGKMWHMPGEQRHEQDLPGISPVIILHADSVIGEVLLPQLHTVVEFPLPKALSWLATPDRGPPT